MENTEIKLTEEELQKLVSVYQKLNNLTVQFGQLQIDKFSIERVEAKLKEFLVQAETEKATITEELSKTYGDGRIDIDRGVFIPTEPLVKE